MFWSVKHGALNGEKARQNGGEQNRKERDRGRSAHPKAKRQYEVTD